MGGDGLHVHGGWHRHGRRAGGLPGGTQDSEGVVAGAAGLSGPQHRSKVEHVHTELGLLTSGVGSVGVGEALVLSGKGQYCLDTKMLG